MRTSTNNNSISKTAEAACIDILIAFSGDWMDMTGNFDLPQSGFSVNTSDENLERMAELLSCIDCIGATDNLDHLDIKQEIIKTKAWKWKKSEYKELWCRYTFNEKAGDYLNSSGYQAVEYAPKYGKHVHTISTIYGDLRIVLNKDNNKVLSIDGAFSWN